MEKLFSSFFLLLISFSAISQNLKPYILGATFSGDIIEASEKVTAGLQGAGFTVVGQYNPMEVDTRWIAVVSHPSLDKAVKLVGGLTGFASTLRVGITVEGGMINISYTNPPYWGNAYFKDNYDKVAGDYGRVDLAFKKALAGIGTMNGSSFGSEKGEEIENLREYHYMFGMPYFDDTNEFGDFDTHEEVITKIEKSLKWGKAGVKLVYRHDVPGTKLTLYGFALSGEDGESNFMPKIDIGDPKHTAFLPYELLVMDNEVHMLHGRYRIALSFPDLTMGTFTKIMSTPGDIEDLLKQLVED